MEVQFKHFRDRTSTKGGGLTVASVADTKGGILYGFAFCSPTDNFSYAEGRKIAVERLTKDPLVVSGVGNLHPKEVTKFVLRLMSSRKFSRLTRRVHTPKSLLCAIPGWFPRWVQLMQNKGQLCLKAVKTEQ